MTVLAAVREEVWARAGGVCERCRGARASELHHRLTRARGGPHDEHNCVALCQPCHVHAHRENEHPWLVAGYIVRGVYTGADEDYQRAYPAPST